MREEGEGTSRLVHTINEGQRREREWDWDGTGQGRDTTTGVAAIINKYNRFTMKRDERDERGRYGGGGGGGGDSSESFLSWFTRYHRRSLLLSHHPLLIHLIGEWLSWLSIMGIHVLLIMSDACHSWLAISISSSSHVLCLLLSCPLLLLSLLL